MKYSIGYKYYDNNKFLQLILENVNKIHEVYFSFGFTPNGRNVSASIDGCTEYEYISSQLKQLKELSKNGIKLNILYNANCYGEKSQSRSFFNEVGNNLDFLKKEINLTSITTTSFLIAKFVKENFADLKVRASVNMDIRSLTAIKASANYFDSFYVAKSLNRQINELKSIKKWCVINGKTLFMLANSGCLSDCPAHIFHNNLVAHERECAEFDNCYQFSNICRDFFKKNKSLVIESLSFVRPEDICKYENIIDCVKLATRSSLNYQEIVRAYIDNKFNGNILSLLEPNFAEIYYPLIIENQLFPKDFFSKISNCDRNCDKCVYCREVYDKTVINIGEYNVNK